MDDLLTKYRSKFDTFLLCQSKFEEFRESYYGYTAIYTHTLFSLIERQEKTKSNFKKREKNKHPSLDKTM